MSSLRAVIWLFIATLAALAANFAVSRYAPASHTAKNTSLFDRGFAPNRITVPNAIAEVSSWIISLPPFLPARRGSGPDS